MRRPSLSLRTLLIGLACLLAAYSIQRMVAFNAPGGRAAKIALLVPDGTSHDDPMLGIWRDAAREEGIDLAVVDASAFLRPDARGTAERFAGIILPDTLHRSASRLLLDRLGDEVRGGAWLMLVYDAATRSADDRWYAGKAPLSALAGIDYGFYDALGDKCVEHAAVTVGAAAMRELSIPPGKTITPVTPAGATGDTARPALSGYVYGRLDYPVFVTRGTYAGRMLLTSSGDSLVAGVHAVDRGGVLFVNLPLGYLKGQTDGVPLHCFLHYFAVDLLHLPTLLATPGGIGGLVFNWHVDSNAALAPIKELDSLGLLEQGPFSIHFTAGPDTYAIGDNAGLNLEHNRELAPWIERFKARGDALGSHGGWIHNYFGLTVNEQNQAQMQQFLELNGRAVTAVSGAPVLEYSAPIGNQPEWVTAWLEFNGVLAYYFTGNSGMAPTRSYRRACSRRGGYGLFRLPSWATLPRSRKLRTPGWMRRPWPSGCPNSVILPPTRPRSGRSIRIPPGGTVTCRRSSSGSGARARFPRRGAFIGTR